MQMSRETVTNWAIFCRPVCFDSILEDWSFKPIGGPGIEVEIDESKFSRMKYGEVKPRSPTTGSLAGLSVAMEPMDSLKSLLVGMRLH